MTKPVPRVMSGHKAERREDHMKPFRTRECKRRLKVRTKSPCIGPTAGTWDKVWLS